MRPGGGDHLALGDGAGVVHFRETGGEHDHGLAAAFGQVLDRRGGQFGRDRDDGDIRRLRQIGDRRIGFQALDFRPVRVDRIQAARKILRPHVGDGASADAGGIGRRAEHGDGTGGEQRGQACETRHNNGRFPDCGAAVDRRAGILDRESWDRNFRGFGGGWKTDRSERKFNRSGQKRPSGLVNRPTRASG